MLINKRRELKLDDFGLMQPKSILTKTHSNELMPLWYMPPGILLGSTYHSNQCGVWAAFSMRWLWAGPLFLDLMVEEQLYFIFHILGTTTEETRRSILSKEEFKMHNYLKYPC